MIPTEKKAGTTKLLFRSAHKMGLQPSWVVPEGLFVVATPKGERYIAINGSNLNSHISSSLSRNKYHTRLILERNDMPNIPFARGASLPQAIAFLEQYKTIIVKPLDGSGSKNIHIVNSVEQLTSLDLSGCILEQYIPGVEMRYLVLNGAVIAVHESKYGDSVDKDRYLERVSYDAATWDPELDRMAVDISEVLGLTFSAVDYIIDSNGNAFVLEVNSRPGLKWFLDPSEGPSVDVATLFLQAMLSS